MQTATTHSNTPPHTQDEIIRWSAVWQYSVQQLCSRSKHLHEKVACLLNEEELTFYHSVPKPRQTVVLQLRRLVTMAGLDTAKVGTRGRVLLCGCGCSFAITGCAAAL